MTHPLRIVLVGTSGMPFSEHDVEMVPLGGTEHNIIKLAQAFRRCGMEVVVLAHPGCVGIDYLPVTPEEARDFLATATYDAIIYNNAVPVPWGEVVPSRVSRLLCTHLEAVVPWLTSVESLTWVDAVVGQSVSALAALRTQMGTLPLVQIEPGIELHQFRAMPEPERQPYQAIYCATPSRGLVTLVDWAEDLMAIDARLRIVVSSGWEIYDQDKTHQRLDDPFWGNGMAQDLTERLAPYRERLFCDVRARPYPDLITALRQSCVMLQPSVFRETWCATVRYAQAAGTPVVATGDTAVLEAAPTQMLLTLAIEEERYKTAFLTMVEKTLHDPCWWQTFHRSGQRAIHRPSATWEAKVHQWVKLIRHVRSAKRHGRGLWV